MISFQVDDRRARQIFAKRKKVLLSKRRRKAALRSGAKEVQRLAQKYVPVDTGRLRGSITMGELREAVTVEAREPYATKIEYKEQPFMRPAAREGFPKAEREIASIYKKAR